MYKKGEIIEIDEGKALLIEPVAYYDDVTKEGWFVQLNNGTKVMRRIKRKD